MNRTDTSDHLVLRLHPRDHVAVVTSPVRAGQDIYCDSYHVVAEDHIPGSQKVALEAVRSGQPVLKYGQVIGFATEDIFPGQHVHSHNLKMRDFGREYVFATDTVDLPRYNNGDTRHFHGFARPGGKVGTRNYIAIVSSVNCSASVSKYVVEQFRDVQKHYPNVDGVVAFTHKSGCCVQPGEPSQILQRTLAGMAQHPNVFGYVMIGVGCEGNQIQFIRDEHKLDVLQPGQPRPAFMNIQDTGGVASTVRAAADAVAKLLPEADAAQRTRQPLSAITLGMNCGGSDGNSGITANPALGLASDELVKHGGTSVLAETTEIYGAEHLLMRRAVNERVGRNLERRIRWWETHVRLHGASIDNNPTFGNKAGGLTTIYEKSLGAIAKAGVAPLAAVYEYAQPIDTPGLCFMDTPGFDPVSMTGIAAGGCNLGVFTTGRGSVYGCKPMPTIKIATNSDLYERMESDMDINAGTVLTGEETLQEVGVRIFDKLIAVASGEKTKSEQQGIGDEEFAPWILGPTL